MPDGVPITERNYYEYLPRLDHQCGDIWVGMPTLGLMPSAAVSGIIITPACDLSNRKSETITYLPILPVASYFLTGAEIPAISAKIRNLCANVKFSSTVRWRDDQRIPPAKEELESDIARLEGRLTESRLSKDAASAISRIIAGLRVLKEPEAIEAAQHLACLFGVDWERGLRRIVSNSYSNDVHFLPSDLQAAGFSGVPHHSVALFRYPITIPSSILDLAMSASPEIWGELVVEHAPSIPMVSNFAQMLPFKALTLKPAFMSDLLTRYVALYNRIGSPDFAQSTISRIVQEVR